MPISIAIKKTPTEVGEWYSVLNNTYWTASIGSWDGSKWVGGAGSISLTPVGFWTNEYRPTKCKITYSQQTGGDPFPMEFTIQDVLSDGIWGGNITSTNSVREFYLDFSSDQNIGSLDMVVVEGPLEVTSIEFFSEVDPAEIGPPVIECPQLTNNNGFIEVYVWNDGLYENGLINSGEDGIDQATITLYNSGMLPLAMTQTDPSGIGLFTSVPSGTYYIGVTQPGYSPTLKGVGANPLSNSHINVGTGITDAIIFDDASGTLYVNAGLVL